MANQEVHDFWGKIVDQYGRAIKEARPDIQIVGAIQGNAYQTYERGATFDLNSEQMLKLSPYNIDVGDRVVITTASDGGKYIQGKIVETADNEINPSDWMFQRIIISNSASTTATAVVGTFSRNVGSDTVNLPPGTWTLIAHCWGMYSHSVANGIVRVRLLVDSDAGTYLTMTAPLNPERTGIGVANVTAGLSGTITVSMEYCPHVSGSAYAGGGYIIITGFRTA